MFVPVASDTQFLACVHGHLNLDTTSMRNSAIMMQWLHVVKLEWLQIPASTLKQNIMEQKKQAKGYSKKG